jgi:hypothetical protein
MENNIKMYLKEMGCESVEWIPDAHDWCKCQAVVNGVMDFRVP